MIEPCERPGFPGEAFDPRRIAREFRRQDLQRDNTVEVGLTGFIDAPHAAGPERREDFQLRKRPAQGVEIQRRREGIR